MIRPRIIRILLNKEFLRLRKNPSAITLLVLLAAVALLVSLSWTDPDTGDSKCFVAYDKSWSNSGWIRYLKKYQYLQPNLEVVPRETIGGENGELKLSGTECAIELLPARRHRNGMPKIEVVYHYPHNQEALVSRHASWYWVSWKQYGSRTVNYQVSHRPRAPEPSAGMASTIRNSAANELDISLIATMLLLSVQFFACCHLYVSFASQDRERGTLQALAMSPASITEIIVARTIFHQLIGLAVCALILLIIRPAAFSQPQIWLTLVSAGFAWLAVATIITTMTRTQSQASMMMFCYMLCGGILFFMASQFSIFALLQNLAFENHAVNILHTGIDSGYILLVPMVAMLCLCCAWMVFALGFFQRRGWQT